MNLTKFIRTYPYLSTEEIAKILGGMYYHSWLHLYSFENDVNRLNNNRKNAIIEGKNHVPAWPLVQVFSVRVQPNKVDENKPLTIYGRIYGELHDDMASGSMTTHDLFNRKFNDPEILGPTGLLTLIGPARTGWPYDAYMPLHQTSIVVDVYDGAHNDAFAQESFSLVETTEDDYEQVKEKVVIGTSGSLSVLYVVMPLAVLCHVETTFYPKISQNGKSTCQIVDFYGKIAARYGNTYGNYASEECTLFEKQYDEFERMVTDEADVVKQSRYWMSVPAYSSLIIDLDLSEFHSKHQIIKETIELPVGATCASGGEFILDKLLISVTVNWCLSSPQLHRIYEYQHPMPEEESDVELEDESYDDQLSSSVRNRWILHLQKPKPLPSILMEVYSVVICRGKSRALRLFGTIEASNGEHAYCIFNRQDKNAMELPEHRKTVLLDGSWAVVDDTLLHDKYSLKLKFDLKDVEGHISIKGIVDWEYKSIKFSPPYFSDNKLCSVIQGENGFAVVYYNIFLKAVQANIEVCYELKLGDFDICPMVFGSIVTQYNNYDYSIRHERDYYRCVLFERIREDSLQVETDGRIPLSRSVGVVPSSSSLIVAVDISIIDQSSGEFVQRLSCSLEIEIGASFRSLETEHGRVYINLKWNDVE